MADGVPINDNTNTSRTINTDSVSSVETQRMKVTYSTDGSAPTDVDATHGLPVKLGTSSDGRLPSWSVVAVRSPTMLARGSVSRSTVDLTNLVGALLQIGIGRQDATAIDVAPQIRVRRVIAAGNSRRSGPTFAASGETTASVSGVAAGSGNNAGVTTLTLNAAKTFVAGMDGEINLCVIDNTTTPTTASEFVRQAFATSTTAKLLDAPTISAHNSTSHTVSDRASIFGPIQLEGGAVYEVIIDYSSATTGSSIYIESHIEEYAGMAN